MLAVAEYSSEVQQPIRAAAVLDGRQHMPQAALLAASGASPVVRDEEATASCPLRR